MVIRKPVADPGRARLVGLAAAAEELSVSVKTLRRRIADGTIPGYRVGRQIRVNVEEMRRALVRPMRSAR